MRHLLKLFGKMLTFAACLAAAIAAAIYGLETYLIWTNGMPTDEQLGRTKWRHLTHYPHSGTHIGEHIHHQGPMPWENQSFYTDFDVRSGDHGFFVDIDLEAPPPKAEREFRVLLVGGSGAQGWGGRTNAEMFYKQLESRLNDAISPRTGLRYTVINLAMAGSTSYQNFIALNTWGHALAPDAIISYSGGNDIFVPMTTGSDAWYHYHMSSANARNSLPDPTPASDYLDGHFPGIAAYTGVKQYFGGPPPAVRRRYLHRDRYNSSRGLKGKDAVFGVALPTYTHALRSTKRDFQGIPMMVMFQAIDWRHVYPYLEVEYAEFTRRAEASLTGYVNDRWFFLNLHAHWNEKNLWDEAVYGLHLPSHLQELVARTVVEKSPPWFWERESRSAEAAASIGGVVR